jgi:hypothetical protein
MHVRQSVPRVVIAEILTSYYAIMLMSSHCGGHGMVQGLRINLSKWNTIVDDSSSYCRIEILRLQSIR